MQDPRLTHHADLQIRSISAVLILPRGGIIEVGNETTASFSYHRRAASELQHRLDSRPQQLQSASRGGKPMFRKLLFAQCVSRRPTPPGYGNLSVFSRRRMGEVPAIIRRLWREVDRRPVAQGSPTPNSRRPLQHAAASRGDVGHRPVLPILPRRSRCERREREETSARTWWARWDDMAELVRRCSTAHSAPRINQTVAMRERSVMGTSNLLDRRSWLVHEQCVAKRPAK